MKHTIFIFTILVLLLFGCRRELAVQPNQTQSSNYAIHLFGIVNADTLFADSAQVTIDGKSAGLADSHGVFVTSSIGSGEHNLSITQKLFSNYNGVCRFEEIHDIYLPLVVSVADFFPLKVGAKWVYRYDYAEGDYVPSDPSFAGTGTITWEILSSQSNQDTNRFYCSELFCPDSASVPWLSSDTAYFNFIESTNHRITLAWFFPLTNLAIFRNQLSDGLGSLYALYRFQPSNGPDSLVFKGHFGPFSAHYIATVRKGIGLYSYDGYQITGTYQEHFYYRLETYTIP
jgi:hypothetical protein